jgi:hypothetical protein
MCGRPAVARTQSGNLDGTCSASPEIRKSIELALVAGGTGDGRLMSAFPCLSLPPNTSFTIARRWRDPLYRATYFRLRCVPSSACLPFLVTATDETERGRRSGESEHERRVSQVGADVRERNSSISKEPLGLPEVMPGQIITLIWERNGMRLSRKVVCLDGGARGEQVRARPQGSSRILKGRVIGPGIVETLS